MESLNEESRIRPLNIKDQNLYSVAKTPKIPAFDENLDDYFALRGMLLFRDGREINGPPI